MLETLNGNPSLRSRAQQGLLRQFNLVGLLTCLILLVPATVRSADAPAEVLKARTEPPAAGPDLDLTSASVTFDEELDLLIFEAQVAGTAGKTTPSPRGSLDGAPVLGYVFPTDLNPTDVGFRADDGIVALAVTSHPDFDDTPLWDENGNGNWQDDGVVFHTHWVVLDADSRVPGGLSVRQIGETEIARLLPPTHPGMPMMMDSPGFSVLLRGKTIKILVPAQRVKAKTAFHFDAVVAYMEVGTSGDRPLLGVYHVYEVLSGDLSLPYEVDR